jgi:hypothetical protein
MNTKPSNSNQYNSPPASSNDLRIDAALGVYSRSTPAPGLESRVATRIANARQESFRTRSAAHRLLWQRLSVGALATAGACAIVVGTVQHSHRDLSRLATKPPVNASSGVSTAETQHIPTRATPASPQIDPQSPRRPAHGRATVTRNQPRHPDGVAVPRSPYPPDEQSGSQDKPEQ